MSYITDDNVSNNNASDSKYLAIFECYHENMLVDQTIKISDFGERASNIEIIEESKEGINEINTRATREKSGLNETSKSGIMNEIDDDMGEASKADKKRKKKAISHKAENKPNLPELPEFEPLHTFSNHHGYSTLPHEMQIGTISPIVLFRLCFSDKQLQIIVENTNKYEQIKSYEGGLEDLWNSNEKMAVHNIKQFMSLYQFQQIKRFLHISNPTEPKSYWYSKIEPLASNLQKIFKKLYTSSTRVSIDEMIVQFSDHSMYTFKIKNKPTPEGYKIFSLCDAGACSTVRTNSSKFPKILKLENPLVLDWDTLSAMIDNSPVYLLTTIHQIIGDEWKITHNHHCPHITSTNARKVHQVFGDNVRKELKIPKLIDDYNHYMKGVDIADQLRSYYNCQLTAHHTWFPLFFWLLDTTLDLIQENLKITTKKITRKRPNNVFSAESSKN
ncbi:24477_t:CDS:2, partial [Cetraspora pellucida]